MSTGDFESQAGPLARRIARLTRALRWRWKGVLRQPRTLLVELRWRLGDEIMALPVLEALRARYPQDRIAVLTNHPDLYLDSPDVDAVNPEGIDPDRYVLLRGASRLRYRLAEYAARAHVPPPRARPLLHYASWHTALLDHLPLRGGPLIAIAAGSTWPTKQWPIARWRALCRQLHDHGARLVELGAGNVPAGAGLCLVDRTTVREAACVLRHADLLVCADTGLMHLALAVETPVVALFGPTDPSFLIRDEPRLTALRSDLPCTGLWNHAPADYDPAVCPHGHDNCLATITVEDVLAAVQARVPLPR
jgi:ADP-heptose:LPS heptosyltransferase